MPTLRCCIICGETKHSSDTIYMYWAQKTTGVLRLKVGTPSQSIHNYLGTVTVDKVATCTLWTPKIFLKTTGVFWSKGCTYLIKTTPQWSLSDYPYTWPHDQPSQYSLLMIFLPQLYVSHVGHNTSTSLQVLQSYMYMFIVSHFFSHIVAQMPNVLPV